METFFFVLEIVGVVAFAVSATVASIDSEVDLFGALFLSLVTCFGGGIMRDVMIGDTPRFFTNYFLIFCAVVTCLVVFVTAAIYKKGYVKHEIIIDTVNNYFDAVGLGIFAVMGAKICISSGNTSAIIAISLGMVTAIGGGMIRDLCLDKIPFVLRKRVYAVAAIAGATVYYLLWRFTPVPEYASILLGVITVFGIRLAATRFKLNMPKAIIFSKDIAEEEEPKVTVNK